MAYVFGTDYTGCFVGMAVNGNFHSTGIRGLSGGSFLSNGGARGFLVTNVEYDVSIKYFILPCFNNSATLYTFGRDWEKNMINISVTALLGRASQLNGGGGGAGGDNSPFTSMNEMFGSGNVLANPKPATIYVRGSTVASGYLVGMSSSTASTANNVQTFSLAFVLSSAS